MILFATIVITLIFAAIGFFIALKIVVKRKENKNKFLMTALVCVTLAVVASGLVRKPVLKILRGNTPAMSIEKAMAGNKLFALLEEASPEAAEQFRSSSKAMAAQALEEGRALTLSDWDLSVILWEKLIPGGVGIAPDDAAVLFAKGLALRLRELHQQDPTLALALLSPRAFPDADPIALSLTGKLGEGVRAVVLGAFAAPVPLNDPDESKALFDLAMADYVAQQAKDGASPLNVSQHLEALENPEALRQAVDPALSLFMADLLDYLLTRPKAEQPILVKFVFSGPQ